MPKKKQLATNMITLFLHFGFSTTQLMYSQLLKYHTDVDAYVIFMEQLKLFRNDLAVKNIT